MTAMTDDTALGPAVRHFRHSHRVWLKCHSSRRPLWGNEENGENVSEGKGGEDREGGRER